MAPPAAISPVSPPSPTLDSVNKLTKAGTNTIKSETIFNESPAISDLDASRLTIIPNLNPRTTVPTPDSPEVWAQNVTTDHMLTARWTQATGWDAPEIRPFGPLAISPIASVLHYATECFEGLKAYRGHDGRVRLFRPERNAARFLTSATRISLPGFPPEEFLKLVSRFVGVEAAKWLPTNGSYIYLRPTMIATAAALGVQRPKEALLYIVAMMFPPLDEPKKISSLLPNSNDEKTAPAQGMRLLASKHDSIRAWPGGFGNAKVGANYGPSLVAQGEARARGYDQILWLFSEYCYVTEAGGSNFFVLWKDAAGQLELVTAPLDDGVILEGVTRNSVLNIARERLPDVKVTERRFKMQEIVQAEKEGRLVEAFASGTAFFIAPVSDIHFRGVDIVLPLGKGVESKYALSIKQWLRDIMFGVEQHPWALVVEEEKL